MGDEQYQPSPGPKVEPRAGDQNMKPLSCSRGVRDEAVTCLNAIGRGWRRPVPWHRDDEDGECDNSNDQDSWYRHGSLDLGSIY